MDGVMTQTAVAAKPVAIRARHGGGKVHRSTIEPHAPQVYVGQAVCHQTGPDLIRVAPGTRIGPTDACRHCWGATNDTILAALAVD